MAYYHLEPVLYYTHVLKAYADVDHYVEIRLLADNKPLDVSEATSVSLMAGKDAVPAESVDMSKASDGIIRVSFKGFEPGAYWVPVSLILDGETVVFGHVRVFVQDTRRSDDVTSFFYYPDTDEEEEEWSGIYGGTDPDEETEPGPEEETEPGPEEGGDPETDEATNNGDKD